MEYETDMNIRLQRESQEAARTKLRELSRYNEQLGAAVSYLLDTVQQSSPGDSGKKAKPAAKRKSAGKSGQVTPGPVSSH